jgi:hypothetical protein
LTAQYDRADGQALFFFRQVGNDEGGLVRSDTAGFIVAGKEFDYVLAGQKSKAGIVLDGQLG